MVYKAPALYSGKIDQDYLILAPLPPFIIEEIREREKERKEKEESPRIQPTLPLPPAVDPTHIDVDKKDEGDRGVIIIDLGRDNIESLV